MPRKFEKIESKQFPHGENKGGESGENSVEEQFNEETLTKEIKKKYPGEFEEIKKMVQEAGYEKIEITNSFRECRPDTVFFPMMYFLNYCQVKKLISEGEKPPFSIEDVNQGLFTHFKTRKEKLETPEYKILSEKRKKETQIREEIGLIEQEEKQEEKQIERVGIKKEIEEIEKKLSKEPRKTLSDVEAKVLALQYAVINLLEEGIDGISGIGLAQISKKVSEGKITPEEGRKQRSDFTLLPIAFLEEKYSNLDTKSFKQLLTQLRKITTDWGEWALIRKEKREKQEEEENISRYIR